MRISDWIQTCALPILITPELGDRKRYTTIPDLYTSKTQLYNATLDYQFDGAHLTSSSSYGYQDGLFEVDLGGTFGLAVPFNLFDHGVWKTLVQETRLVRSEEHSSELQSLILHSYAV